MKKRIYMICAACMLVLSISACTGTAQPPQEASTAAQNAGTTSAAEASTDAGTTQDADTADTTAAKETKTRIVRDVWNREVEIPAEVDSIVCLGSMGPRFAAYLDATDMMVGAEDNDIENMSVRYDYSLPYHDKLKELPSVGPGGGSGENNAYAEEIIVLQPDVIIAGFNEDACEELQQQTGIPVVSIRYRTQGFIDEGFHRSMRVFAEVIGKEERCEEVLSYVDACKEDLQNRTADIPDEEKLRAYTGAVTFNGRHGFAFTYVNFPAFTAVNAFNVADEFLESQTGDAAAEASSSGTAYIGNDGFEVDMEQIIEWDPDIIFLDPGNMDLVNEEYAQNPAFFDSLRAVQEGQVYTMPSTNAAGPNVTYLLINAYFAGITLYPEQFADVNLEEKAAEIMNLMLGTAFFEEMEAGGLYYGTITIGE